METVRVHAMEGGMISSLGGIEKLRAVLSLYDNPCQVVVISPVRSGELSFSHLLSNAALKDEKLWSLLEKSQNSWEDFLSKTSSSAFVDDELRRHFEDMEDLLRSVWLLEDVSKNTENYFSSLTSTFLAAVACDYLARNGISCTAIEARTALRAKSFTNGVTLVYGTLEQSPTSSYVGEGESEYTAALIAAQCNAGITYWNTRSLFCSASSREIPSAKVIKRLTYAEATEKTKER